ncbi:MAG: hypothetical protein M0Z54_02610 [Thermaerobacter sp.]|nr:hypothetical protein [Thermaerobacter sp.]
MGPLRRVVLQLGVCHLSPPIHRMVHHFPIALCMRAPAPTRSAERDRFWNPAANWRLTLSDSAGAISEHSVHLTHTTAGRLAAQHRGVTLTGLFVLLAGGFPLAARLAGVGGPSGSLLGTGRRRVTAAVLPWGIAAGMLSLPGHARW